MDILDQVFWWTCLHICLEDASNNGTDMTWSVCVCIHAQLCPTHCIPMNSSLPVRLLCPWNFQARIPEYVDLSYSKRSSPPRDRNCVPSNGRWILYHSATWGEWSVFIVWNCPFFNAIVTFYICAKPALTSYPSNTVAIAGVRRQAENESPNSSISEEQVIPPLPFSTSLPGIPCFLFDQREQAFLMHVSAFIYFPSPVGTLGYSPLWFSVRDIRKIIKKT